MQIAETYAQYRRYEEWAGGQWRPNRSLNTPLFWVNLHSTVNLLKYRKHQ